SSPARAGGTVLSLIAAPLSVPVLRAHLDGSLRLPDLDERISGAGLTTLRGQVVNLRRISALERHVRSGMPYTVENELTDRGRGILAVAGLVEAWLARAPQGPIALGSEPAKRAIRALVGGWSSTMLHALAARPLSLTELSSLIGDFSYPSLERRLSAMRAARQVEARSTDGTGAKPFDVSQWTRWAVAPLLAAGRCEREHLSGMTKPLTRIDIEAAFRLAVPLVDLQVAHRGAYLLAIGTDAAGADQEDAERVSGVGVEVEDGVITACVSPLESGPPAWAIGTVDSWVDAILEGKLERLRLGGEQPALAKVVIESLHAALFAA
ncbi:MAG: winged helix-turn-helix transcriptional regulator, partial [Thermoanaerobaculia bacterium]